MEIDLLNKKDRLIFEVYGEDQQNGIFDINQTNISKVFAISEEINLDNVFFVIEELFIKEKLSVNNDDTILRNSISRLITEKTGLEEKYIQEKVNIIMSYLHKVIPEVYVAFNYEIDNDDNESITYNTNKSTYLEPYEVHLYVIKDKIIYEYDGNKNIPIAYMKD